MQEFIKQNIENYNASLVEVDKEKVLYITIPYKGCTQCPRCLFCGVQEVPNKNLKIDLYMEEKNQLKKTVVNQNKDSYKIMKNNYLEDRGIIIDDSINNTDNNAENNTEIKLKKKKLVKIKKKKN